MGNNIKIGDNNKIKNSNIVGGNIVEAKEKEKHRFSKYFLVPLIVTVVGGIIVGIVLFLIKVNRD